MVSLFTILTISLGMTMIILLAALYNSYTGNIGPYQHRDRCLYLANLKFEQDGKIVGRYRDKHSTSSFIDTYLRTLETPEIIGMYGRPVGWNLGSKYKPFRVKYLETDASFWKIHHFKFLDGRSFHPQEVEQKEKVCILSKKAADFLFPDGKAVEKYYKGPHDRKFRIIGVIQNEHPHFEVAADLYIPYTLTVWDENNSFYDDRNKCDVYYNRGGYKGVLLLAKNTSMSVVKKEFNQLIKKINKQGKVEEFDHIRTELKSSTQLIPRLLFPGGNDIDMIVFVAMGLCFLLVPIVILSNINIYSLRDRVEEIGVRKSYGASRRMVVLQFFVENILLTIVGGVVALFLAVPLNKTLSQIIFHSQEVVGMEFNLTFFTLLILGAIVFGIMTVVFPALRISRVLPAVAIHHQQPNYNTGFLFKKRKKSLQVVTNFILFTVVSLCGFIVSYIYNNVLSGVGYNPQNVITLMLNENGVKDYSDKYNRSHFEGFREKLLQIPQVSQVSYVLENPPAYIVPQYLNYNLAGTETEIRTLETDTCFFKLLGIKPMAGELYTSELNSIGYIPGVATQAAEKKYFNGEAIGKTITRKQDGKKVKIVGVIQKYKHHPIALDFCGIFTCRNYPSRSVLIQFKSGSDFVVLDEKIQKTIRDNYSNCSHSQQIEVAPEFNRAIERKKSIFYGVLLACGFLLINAFLGFFTLIWYNVQARKKEMGIRRAVGASKNLIQHKILLENLVLMLIGSGISAILISQFVLITLPKNRLEFYWNGLLWSFVITLSMTLLSAWIPARSARNVQPVDALAEE